MKSESAELQVVTFRTGLETYGMGIGHIREIIMPQEITPVPGMADAIKGIINLRGEIIPVVDLAAILSLAAAGDVPGRKHRVIILDQNQGGYGVLVDEVMEVIKIREEDVSANIGNDQIVLNDQMVKGVIHYRSKMIIYLDPLEMLNSSPAVPDNSLEMEEETATVPI